MSNIEKLRAIMDYLTPALKAYQLAYASSDLRAVVEASGPVFHYREEMKKLLSDRMIAALIAVAETAGALDDGLLDGGDSAYLCPEALAARMNKALVDLEAVKLP
jgi:hypothetical protein